LVLDFTDRRILITGASKGIGAATARLVGGSGACVGVHFNRDEAGAAQVAEAIRSAGGRAILLQGDLRHEQPCVDLVERFAAEAGGLDSLVNNAGGIVFRGPATDYSVGAFNDTFALNCTSAFVCTRTAIPHLRHGAPGAPARNASVVMLSSVATRFGPTNVVAYASAKAWLNGMTQSLAKELVGDGIRVNAVAPGVIDTPFHDATPQERLDELAKLIPMKRFGTAEEVANVIAFLLSDLASYVTGECIDVNGGMTVRC
jgi:3-oxoacyl-[acyl-carrier protein] reductase